MPTLPLYTPTDTPGASRRVMAPGGYERWRFDGESASSHMRFVAVIGTGSWHAPDYLRRYARYLRRPTRHPPPVPADYPFGDFAVYDGARPVARFGALYPAGAFSASVEPVAVTIGPNELRRDGDGTYFVTLHGTGSASAGDSLTARLAFRPRWPSAAREIALVGGAGESGHHWVVDAPICDVSCTIVVSDGKGDGRQFEFQGIGYHDHDYGTAPAATEGRARFVGRVLLGDGAYVFAALDRGGPQEVRVLRCSRDGLEEIKDGPARLDWAGETGVSRPYPRELVAGMRLQLCEPRVIESTPDYIRLIYQATANGGTESGTAFCDVENLRGLRHDL